MQQMQTILTNFGPNHLGWPPPQGPDHIRLAGRVLPRRARKEGRGRGPRARCDGPRTAIRDTSCCCHPLTGIPYLRLGPRSAGRRRGGLPVLALCLGAGAARLTAAVIPMENPYCSCKLTRVRRFCWFSGRTRAWLTLSQVRPRLPFPDARREPAPSCGIIFYAPRNSKSAHQLIPDNYYRVVS